MEKDKLNAYAARVSQANRSELVVIIYEAFLDSVAEGKDLLEKKQKQQCRHEIERARGLLTELMGSLDFKYEISYYLRRLYVYCYHELCQGIAEEEADRFDHATAIISKLLVAFQEVANQDNSQPVMKNVQSIYAGLTYGRNKLNESIAVDIHGTRGFEA